MERARWPAGHRGSATRPGLPRDVESPDVVQNDPARAGRLWIPPAKEQNLAVGDRRRARQAWAGPVGPNLTGQPQRGLN